MRSSSVIRSQHTIVVFRFGFAPGSLSPFLIAKFEKRKKKKEERDRMSCGGPQDCARERRTMTGQNHSPTKHSVLFVYLFIFFFILAQCVE